MTHRCIRIRSSVIRRIIGEPNIVVFYTNPRAMPEKFWFRTCRCSIDALGLGICKCQRRDDWLSLIEFLAGSRLPNRYVDFVESCVE